MFQIQYETSFLYQQMNNSWSNGSEVFELIFLISQVMLGLGG